MNSNVNWPINPHDTAEISDAVFGVSDLATQPHSTLLAPTEVVSLLKPGRDLYKLTDSFECTQYYKVISNQHDGQINSSPNEVHYQKHLWRMHRLLSSARGLVLDVGCGDPLVGSSLLNSEVTYVGIDPFASVGNPYCLRGVAEDLPFNDASFDAIVFNTSLDHILDFVTALNEARRVLRSGSLFLSTLVWTDQYSLIHDHVHFHHFRQFEISGALDHCGFRVVSCSWYRYKDDKHRVGLYLHATSTGGPST